MEAEHLKIADFGLAPEEPKDQNDVTGGKHRCGGEHRFVPPVRQFFPWKKEPSREMIQHLNMKKKIVVDH
jgi:hypothetical protein